MKNAYDYRDALYNDILDWFNENPENKEKSYDENYDELWITDSVTGNASGSYTFNRAAAKENLNNNFDLICDAMTEFGCLDELVDKVRNEEWEYLDVTIRCYLLGSALYKVRDTLGL